MKKGWKLRNTKWIHFAGGFKWTGTLGNKKKSWEITWWGRTTIIYWGSVWSKFSPLFRCLFQGLSIEPSRNRTLLRAPPSPLNPRHFNILSICVSSSAVFIALNIHNGMERNEKVTSRLLYGHASRSVMILQASPWIREVRSKLVHSHLPASNASLLISRFRILDRFAWCLF